MAKFYGTSGNDTLSGTSGSDVLIGDPQRAFAIERVSTDASGAQGNGSSQYPVFSPDGTKVAFWSDASNLVAGDTNGVHDIFVKDLTTGAIERISTDASGAQANSNCESPVFSPDGSKVAFVSSSNNLVAGDTNARDDIFVKDLTTGNIERISTDASGAQGNSNSFNPVFSPDGSKVAFGSDATNLVAGDTNGRGDIFIKDLTTGAIERISTDASGAQGNGHSYAPPVFSPDGSKVVFYSLASNLVAGDTNSNVDIFVKDLVTGAIELISSDASGTQGNGPSYFPVFSPDGSKVAFFSLANNLVAGDTNFNYDIFVKDLTTGAIERISSDASGVQGDGPSFSPVFSPDGSKVVFASFAINLVPGDTNAREDIFVKDLTTGAIQRISTDASGAQANDDSIFPVFSPDGTEVMFFSYASNLVPGDSNNSYDIFIVTLADFGAGGDALIGGGGFDIAAYETALASVTVDLRDGTGASNAGDAAGDTYSGVEQYRLSFHDDFFFGDNTSGANNKAIGLDGIDTFNAGGTGTSNQFFGLEGNDIFNGSGGTTRAYGGNGIDTVNGGLGIDIFFGQAGADIFYGNDGNDAAYGGDDGDTLNGEGGADVLIGEAGVDTLNGGTGNDNLRGGADGDTLNGDDDNDQLRGEAGTDILRGGNGNDTLYGGTEADSFTFNATDTGFDFIRDYELGVDNLTFESLTAGDLTLTVRSTFTDVTIVPSGATIRIMGVTDAVALEADFIFV